MTIRLRPALLAISAALLCCGADRPEGTLDVYFIDVQGGSATLVVTPARESVLIDSGWAGFDDRDPKRIEHAVKEVAGLDHIDHLVTTHWDEDHYGGVGGLARRVRIGHFWDRGLPAQDAPVNRSAFPNGPTPDDPLGAAYRKASTGKRTELHPGDRLPLEGGVEAVVLASDGKLIDAPTGQRNPNCAEARRDRVPAGENANSVVLRFRLGKFEFLETGDLPGNLEDELVCPADRVGQVDLFLATHHGTALSNQPTFLRSIAPTVVVVNNGPRKGGDPVTMTRLKTIPSIQAAYQLHKNVSTDQAVNVPPEQIANADPAGGQLIHVSVQPDGARFRVRAGDGGRARDFDSR